MTASDIRSNVSAWYGERARAALADAAPADPATSCCEPGCCSGDEATATADGVVKLGFGSGEPLAFAAIQPGESVLDLGSGDGTDCLSAAAIAGPEARVAGVDMTPAMIALARANAEKAGATNVDFRLGEIEHLPFPDASFDVVISNCVINLSPEKPRVFAEIARVLRPGGRVAVSDMVWPEAAPAGLEGDAESWAACVAGALTDAEYATQLAEAGFVSVSVELPTETAPDRPAGATIRATKPLG